MGNETLHTNNKPNNISTDRRFLALDDGEIFALAKEAMERRRYLDPEMNMEILAAEIGVHRNSLSRAVNSYAGMSFPLWLAGYRIGEAERLARKEKATLDVIARMAGFKSRTSFYRTYRRVRGVPPSAVIWMGSNINANH